MVDIPTIVTSAVELGYRQYGIKGAVVAGVVVGGGTLGIKKAVSRFTDTGEERIDELIQRVEDDEELDEIIEEEFSKGVGKTVDKVEDILDRYFGDGGAGATA